MGVAVIDSGGANIGSVLQALGRLGVEASLTQKRTDIEQAGHVILPGVGTAHAAMASLKKAQLVSVIQSLTQPVLGVCLGLQLLFESSAENDLEGPGHPTECLGIIPGHIQRLSDSEHVRLPHMGWNQLHWTTRDPMAKDSNPDDWFYFVHSYALNADHPSTIATSHHGETFAAVVREKNFVACQFHPEKSADAGARLLKGFLSS